MPLRAAYTITLAVSWTGHTATSQVSGNGTKSDTVQVYSSCNPVITNQPSNQAVLLGTTAQFTVGASSQFPLSYQWYFNQTAPIVSPPTFATLTLPDVTVLEAGLYSVVVANAYGSATSRLATLTVVTPLVSQCRSQCQRQCDAWLRGASQQRRLESGPPRIWRRPSSGSLSSQIATWGRTAPGSSRTPMRLIIRRGSIASRRRSRAFQRGLAPGWRSGGDAVGQRGLAAPSEQE